ncbi:MAG: toprim domain-containing protein [Minisyncoccia bacterium]|jgi:recombination protein RecR
MDSLRKLEEIFARFPGIGPRQARRFVYYLLNKSPASIKELADLIEEVKKTTAECSRCHRFFVGTDSKIVACPICLDQTRDASSLMVVARDSDFESIEKSGAYKGLYFILGGTVPILDKEAEKRVRLKPLLERIAGKASGIKEVILSLNATPDGENTAEIVKEAILKTATGKRIKVTILGRGLSTGAELEYADTDTIKSALKNRH